MCTITPLVSLEHPAYKSQGWCQQSRPRFTQRSALSDLPDIHTSLLICLISSWLCLPLSTPPSFPRSPPVLSVDLGVPLVRPSFSTTVSFTNAPGMMQERKPSCSNHHPLTFISVLSLWATLQPSPAPRKSLNVSSTHPRGLVCSRCLWLPMSSAQGFPMVAWFSACA